ncbi:MAG: site-specific DNA-methyltransferase [Desulfovibrio sp.]|nr:site-specific DNA-methyltransferase [Desulfovibrio sp.]
MTDEGDTVFDPFGGSCVTGEVAECLNRKWICCELLEEYLIFHWQLKNSNRGRLFFSITLPRYRQA